MVSLCGDFFFPVSLTLLYRLSVLCHIDAFIDALKF